MAKAFGLPHGPNSMLRRAAEKHARWMTALTCKPLPREDPLQPTVRPTANSTLANWAGYEDTAEDPTNVNANWYVPQVASITNGTSGYSSIWAGIGDGSSGVSGGELIQAGTEQDGICNNPPSCTDTIDDYYFWYEAYPYESQQEITNFTPYPGDLVGISAEYAPGVTDDPTAWEVCDWTQDQCVGFTQTTPPPDNTAEWILERTALCNGGTLVYPPLANIGGVSFDSDFVSDDAGYYESIAAQNPVANDMVSDNGTTLATTGALLTGATDSAPTNETTPDFDITWNAYGETDATNPATSCSSLSKLLAILCRLPAEGSAPGTLQSARYPARSQRTSW